MAGSAPGAVVVTGASTGIGAACALHLHGLGYRVFAGVRRPQDGEALRARASDRLIPLLMDVTDHGQITDAVRSVDALVGASGLAGLVNNAGIAIGGVAEFLDIDQYRKQFEVNYFGQIAVTQAFLPLIRRVPGRIVNMSSIAGRVSPPFYSPYASSKHALEAFSDSLRVELAPWGVHVAIIEPGSIDTPIWSKGVETAEELVDELPEHGRTLYEPFIAPGIEASRETGARGIPPQRVAEAVAHALTAKRPKARYLVGRDARIQAFARRILPESTLDRLLRKRMRLPDRPPR